jgi:hypothetical protein
MSQGFY